MKKVLVADDTKNIRNLLTTCLTINGYSVTPAANGIEAIDKITQDSFDLVFLDIKMPEVSGTEVLRRMRAKGISCPVIIMTAFATVKNAVECTKLGAVAYLQKPFTADKVKEVIEQLEELTSIESNSLLCINKAKHLIEEHKLEAASYYLSKAISLSPSEGEIYHLLGLVHEENGNKEDAEKYFKTAKIFGYSEK